MTRRLSLTLSAATLALVLADGCSSNANLGDDGAAGTNAVSTTGGAGPAVSGGWGPASDFGGSYPVLTGGTGAVVAVGGTGPVGPCLGNFEEVAAGYGQAGYVFPCPTDWATAQEWPATCTYGRAWAGSCSGFSALQFTPGLFTTAGIWAKSCYYDASGALVGAVAGWDYNAFCNLTSRTIAGGSFPSTCPITELTDLGDCKPTGGTGGSGPGTGGTGGGPSACSASTPCAAGVCEGSSCAGTWTCVVDGRGCTDDLFDYCGCDGVTFQDSSTCPTRPYQYRGACGSTVDCNARDVFCDGVTPTCPAGQAPRVESHCYAECVSVDRCQCTTREECPPWLTNGVDCNLNTGRCVMLYE